MTYVSHRLHLPILSLGKAVSNIQTLGGHRHQTLARASTLKVADHGLCALSSPHIYLVVTDYPSVSTRNLDNPGHTASVQLHTVSYESPMASVPCEISPGREEGRGLFQTREFTIEVCPRTHPLLGSGSPEHSKHRHDGRDSLC